MPCGAARHSDARIYKIVYNVNVLKIKRRCQQTIVTAMTKLDCENNTVSSKAPNSMYNIKFLRLNTWRAIIGCRADVTAQAAAGR